VLTSCLTTLDLVSRIIDNFPSPVEGLKFSIPSYAFVSNFLRCFSFCAGQLVSICSGLVRGIPGRLVHLRIALRHPPMHLYSLNQRNS
jgi:hypothetical protein